MLWKDFQGIIHLHINTWMVGGYLVATAGLRETIKSKAAIVYPPVRLTTVSQPACVWSVLPKDTMAEMDEVRAWSGNPLLTEQTPTSWVTIRKSWQVSKRQNGLNHSIIQCIIISHFWIELNNVFMHLVRKNLKACKRKAASTSKEKLCRWCIFSITFNSW